MTALREQNRRASPVDFNGRVGVGVGFVPTVDAGEDRLALAALPVHDTALRTGLRRERGGDVDQPAPCGFELVFEHGADAAMRPTFSQVKDEGHAYHDQVLDNARAAILRATGAAQ